jgi:hypothetical protein
MQDVVSAYNYFANAKISKIKINGEIVFSKEMISSIRKQLIEKLENMGIAWWEENGIVVIK